MIKIREQFLGLNDDESLAQQKINRIEDKNIRFEVYFCNEIAAHTLRIKAMAAFCERIGPFADDSTIVFNFWKSREKVIQLQKEARELGMEEEYNSLGQAENAWNKILEIFVEGIDGLKKDSDEQSEALFEKLEKYVDEW